MANRSLRNSEYKGSPPHWFKIEEKTLFLEFFGHHSCKVHFSNNFSTFVHNIGPVLKLNLCYTAPYALIVNTPIKTVKWWGGHPRVLTGPSRFNEIVWFSFKVHLKLNYKVLCIQKLHTPNIYVKKQIEYGSFC